LAGYLATRFLLRFLALHTLGVFAPFRQSSRRWYTTESSRFSEHGALAVVLAGGLTAVYVGFVAVELLE